MKTEGVIVRDGFQLAYKAEGQGIPVLVIGSRLYYPHLFSKELRNKLQLIFLDHRGFAEGPEELNIGDYSLDAVINDTELVREALGLEQFIILGHSGHAFMAAEYARKHPERVSRTILLNTAPSNSKERQAQSASYFEETASPERKKQFAQDISLLSSDIAREPERRFAHLLIRMGAQSFYDYSFDASYMWDGVYTNMPVIDHLWGEVFGSINLRERLAELGHPVFLGLGRYDYLVAPVSLWDSIEESHPHVTKVIFEQSGHNPMLEESEVFDAALLKWLQETE
jgi:proline iminopeptidase